MTWLLNNWWAGYMFGFVAGMGLSIWIGQRK